MTRTHDVVPRAMFPRRPYHMNFAKAYLYLFDTSPSHSR